jgi:hypothetical protein
MDVHLSYYYDEPGSREFADQSGYAGAAATAEPARPDFL